MGFGRSSGRGLNRRVSPGAGGGFAGADGAHADPHLLSARQTSNRDARTRLRYAVGFPQRDVERVGAGLDLVYFCAGGGIPARVEFAVVVAHGEDEVHGVPGGVGHGAGGGCSADLKAGFVEFGDVAGGRAFGIAGEGEEAVDELLPTGVPPVAVGFDDLFVLDQLLLVGDGGRCRARSGRECRGSRRCSRR